MTITPPTSAAGLCNPLCALVGTPHAAQTAAKRVEDGTRRNKRQKSLAFYSPRIAWPATTLSLLPPERTSRSVRAGDRR